MGERTLDTSGYVALVLGPNRVATQYQWRALNPFTQGYIEALFRQFFDDENDRRSEMHGHVNRKIPAEDDYGFSYLAPETLAAILKDCEAYAPDGGMYGYPRGNKSAEADARGFGADLWRNRQRGVFKGFPPLTAYLGDDGKVYLRAAA